MIKNGIIPWGVMLIFGGVLGIIIGAEFVVANIVQDQTKVAINTTCTPKKLEKVWYSSIYLTLDCNGTEHWSRDDETIMNFGNERKIPACTLFKTMRAKCVEQTQD